MFDLSFSVKVINAIIKPRAKKVFNELDSVARPLGVERQSFEKSEFFRKRFLKSSFQGFKRANNYPYTFAKDLGLESEFLFFENTNPSTYIFTIEVTNNYVLKIKSFQRLSGSTNDYLEVEYNIELLDEVKWPNLGEVVSYIKQQMPGLNIFFENKTDLSIDSIKPYEAVLNQRNFERFGILKKRDQRFTFGNNQIQPGSVEVKGIQSGSTKISVSEEGLLVDDDKFFIDFWKGYISLRDNSESSLKDQEYGINLISIPKHFVLEFIPGFSFYELREELLNKKIYMEEEEYFSFTVKNETGVEEIDKMSSVVENDWISDILLADENEWDWKYRWAE